jgi:HEAT repeat protein
MSGSIDLVSARLLVRLVAGSPVEAMEAAKRLIVSRQPSLLGLLLEIAGRGDYKKWARIGAIYTLGLLGNRRCVPFLIRVLGNEAEPRSIRSHAAEALGNLRGRRAVPTVRRVLLDPDESADVKRSSVYALSQIGGRTAVSALRKFGSTGPRGRLGRELAAAIRAASLTRSRSS